MWFKSQTAVLGDFEQLVLMGVLRLGDDAYGAAIRQEIHTKSGRDVSINAVYTTLDRLESKGLLRSWTGEPTAQRGGRRRKFYALERAGIAALRHAYRAFTAMADGLEERLEAK
jgi:DNA-binding PadR family transcriptional regulator